MGRADLKESQRDFIALCGDVCESALTVADHCARRGDADNEAHFRMFAALESQWAFSEAQS